MSNQITLPCDAGQVSDGHHTFDELYEHRQVLFVALANSYPRLAWKARVHSDGSMFEGPKAWFVAGMHLPSGTISYHVEGRFWEFLKVPELERAPEWDGYSPADVVKRLMEWI